VYSSKAQQVSAVPVNQTPTEKQSPGRLKEDAPAPSLLWGCALAGLAGSLLLSAIELLDLNFLLAPAFHSLRDRLTFSAFFSVNLLSGFCIGLLVGLVAFVASHINRFALSAVSRERKPSLSLKLLVGLCVSALAAFLLNQQPHVFGFVISLIREAEKFSALRATLLNHERATSYLTVMALFIACWAIYHLTRRSASMSYRLRSVWFTALVVFIAVFYYIDSRIEVQGYEYSLHRAMFLATFTLAMALAGSAYQSGLSARAAGFRRVVIYSLPFLIACGLIFTFARFDKDQNLKTQLFYRTTQARQHFKLVQWALDFDRDGYSAYLGGGDRDDSNKQVNPSRPEVVGDGLDNNCIGGDLGQAGLDEWNNNLRSMRAAADPGARRLNVIFIFIDALRPDHMSAYGYAKDTTPNIAKLAERSSVFDNAFTPAPNTFEALPKFMQSNYWDAHLKTWTEVLADNGYHTMLFPGPRASTLLRWVKGVEVEPYLKAKGLTKTVDLAIKVINDEPKDRPFCAYIYTVAPHSPYRINEGFDFGSSLEQRYDGEIAFTDFHMGRLFDSLEQSGRLKDTMIVIMADHGESLGERSVYLHSRQLYNDQLRIPMIIYMPDLAPRKIHDYVSSVDLGSTILNAVGLEYPGERAGVSLLPLMRGLAFTHPPVFAEQTSNERSPYVRSDQSVSPEAKKYMVVTQDGFKLIYNRNYSCFELYDLKSDPNELRNLYDGDARKADEMKRRLGTFVDVLTVSRPWDAEESALIGSARARRRFLDPATTP
jgi:arylsulfatase A-like enzyme